MGRLKEAYLKAAEDEYRKRIRKYARLEVKEHKSDGALSASVSSDACLVVLDERGESLSSREFADRILQHEQSHGGGRPLIFAIGGADGHDDALRRRANHTLSFGRLTIAHRLVRVILLEQIYRGFTILAGEPYHRD